TFKTRSPQRYGRFTSSSPFCDSMHFIRQASWTGMARVTTLLRYSKIRLPKQRGTCGSTSGRRWRVRHFFVNDEEIVVWFAETVRLGRVVTRLGQQGERIVADWPGLGRLVVDRFGSTPDYKPAAGAPPELTDKLRLGAARALVGYLRGEVTLHTAAVANGSAGLLFLGDSGVGKSTLAFAMGARKPWSFLSDDLLRLVGVE